MGWEAAKKSHKDERSETADWMLEEYVDTSSALWWGKTGSGRGENKVVIPLTLGSSTTNTLMCNQHQSLECFILPLAD